MNGVAELLNRCSDGWAGLIWSIVWQSTFMAGVIAAISFALRRSSPSVRFWLWQVVAIKLLVMPLWSVSIALPKFLQREEVKVQATSDTAGLGGVGGNTFPLRPEIPASGGTPEPSQPKSWRVGEWLGQFHWQSWLFVAWSVGVVWQLAGVVRHRFRLSRLLGLGTELIDSRVVEMATQLVERIGLGRLPRVVTVDLEGSPFVCGIWKPVLVLPRDILTALDPEQIRQVLLHELAHVKRCDLLWGWIPQLARIFYFFHPIAHWVSYRIRLERELACDQVAMAASGTAVADYAATLVQVVSQSSQPALLRAAAATTVGLTGQCPSAEANQPGKESAR